MRNLNAILRRQETKINNKKAAAKLKLTANPFLTYTNPSLLEDEEMLWDCNRRTATPYELSLFEKISFVQNKHRTGLNKNNFNIYTKDGVIAYIRLENAKGEGYIYSVKDINYADLQGYVLQTRVKLDRLSSVAHTFTGEILICKNARLAGGQSWNNSSSQHLVKFQNGKFISETEIFINDDYASQGWATCEYVKTINTSGEMVDKLDYPNVVEVYNSDTNSGSWKNFTFQGKVVDRSFFQSNLSYGIQKDTNYKAVVLGEYWN